jgi:hypothetical protein
VTISRNDLLAALEAWEINLEEYRQIQKEYKKDGDDKGVMFSQGFIDIANEGVTNTRRSLEAFSG